MPLIIVTGFPTSGKSTRAKQLHDYLSERIADSKHRLHLISDDSLSISRTVYDLAAVPAHTRSANASEKDARASLYGAVKRVLSDKDIVILDGLNYIKGWRYQLHCEAKAMRTPSCVLQIGCAPDRAKQVNQARLDRRAAAERGEEQQASEEGPEPYEQSNWDNLVFRYEEPNPMTRWDSPLFTLIWEDDEAQAAQTFASLWDAIAGDGRKVVKPNQSTEPRGRDAGGDYLYVLDRETQYIVKRILDQQGDEAGGEVKIPLNGESTTQDSLVVDLPTLKKLSLPGLQRHRRAFMGLNRGGIGLEAVGNMAVDQIRALFVRYLNDAFEKEE